MPAAASGSSGKRREGVVTLFRTVACSTWFDQGLAKRGGREWGSTTGA
jgi:hypothetical protein